MKRWMILPIATRALIGTGLATAAGPAAETHAPHGLAPDLAIEQSCADCHNHHPNSHKRDFKTGDLMGAIVVRSTAAE